MGSRVNVASVVCTLSVLALYVETSLQIYVTVSADHTAMPTSPRALVSLSTMCLSFISTSLTSYIMTSSNAQFGKGCDKDKLSFYSLHLLQFGMVWRIIRLFLSLSGSDVKRLADLRLVHVALQSLPYVLIYSTTFLMKGRINAVQSLSLIVSLVSSALAVSCYNLRRKLYVDTEDGEETSDSKHSGRSLKAVCAILTTFTGTLLVLFSRSVSITLMAAQVRLWILLPLLLHFILILIAFAVFSSRAQGQSSRTLSFLKSACYCLGLSVLNSFDLVYDNVAQIMCKYVAFYSLLLVENIIFVSFWLLNFDLDYVSKLVTVLGILSGFIIGLIIKFTGINILQRGVAKSQSEEVLSQGSQGFPSIATTTTSATLKIGAHHFKDSDDLISIVQASLAKRVPKNDSNIEETSITQMDSLSTQAKDGRIKSKKRKSKTNELKKIRNETSVVRPGDQDRKRHERKRVTKREDLPEVNKPVGSISPNATEQDDSFQHSSIFSVSDPETLLSDMMYGELAGDANQSHTGLAERYDACSKRLRAAREMEHKLSESSSSWEGARQSGQISHVNQTFISHGRNISKKKSSPPNNTTVSQLVEYHSMRGGHVNNKSCDELKHQQESSDTAMSSNKTYPYDNRKIGPKENGSRFDQRMKNILSSIEDRTFLDKIPRSNSASKNLDNTNNTGTMQSVGRSERRARKNIISYTDVDGIAIDVHNGRDKDNSRKEKCSFVQENENQQSRDDQNNQPNDILPQATGVQPQSAVRLCESGSSSSFASFTNGTMSQTGSSSSSHSTTTLTTEDCWQEEMGGQSSDAKSDKLSQFLLQSDVSRMSPSENILRWLSTTAHAQNSLDPP